MAKLGLLVGVAVLVSGLLAAHQEQPGKAARAQEPVLECKGYVVPVAILQVTPSVSGVVVECLVEEGKRVKKGEVIARLDPRLAEAELHRAHAAVKRAQVRLEQQRAEAEQSKAEAEAALEQAEALVHMARKRLERIRKLADSNTVDAGHVEEAEAGLRTAELEVRRRKAAYAAQQGGAAAARLEAARAEVAVAEADLLRARVLLEGTQVRAPVDGTVLVKRADVGSFVGPQALGGSPAVCELSDLTRLEVDLAIQERDLKLVQAGQDCKVRIEAYPDKVYQGVVSRIMPLADRARGAVPVRVRFAVPEGETRVRPEMGAIVSFLGTKN